MNAERSPGKQTQPMSQFIPLGRYAGVEVRAHWSLLITLLLLTQILAIGLLPSALPERQPATYWLSGAAVAVVFVAAILTHELAHAWTAGRCGIRVKHVTLWMLGGSTELDGEPASPRAEAAVAVSGPAASLGLGAVFAGLAWLTWLLDGPQLVHAALAWLAIVNVILAGFNLLPAAPLDGGRLLRAALWQHHRDWIRATQASARAGSFLGTALIAWGALQALNGLLLGVWLILIGWFVIGAAATERQAAVAKRLTGRVARDIMTSPPGVAPSWWSVADFLADLERRGYTGQQVFPLVDFEGRPTVLLTLRDIARVPAAERDSTALRDAARSRMPALRVAPDAPLADLLLTIRARGGIAVVVEQERVVGTVSHTDLAAAVTMASLGTATGGADRQPAPADPADLLPAPSPTPTPR